MPTEVKRFKCIHCKYTRAKKKTVEFHESICFLNPETKSCATCQYLSLEVSGVDDEPTGNHFCTKKNSVIKLTTKCNLHRLI